jgi:hypothetical protein
LHGKPSPEKGYDLHGKPSPEKGYGLRGIVSSKKGKFVVLCFILRSKNPVQRPDE